MVDCVLRCLVVALCLMVALGARPREEILAAKVFRAADGRSMPYRLYVPADSTARKRFPLVLFLHGGGGRGDDNRKQIEGGNGYLVDSLVSPGTEAKHACIVVAPQSSRLGWVDHDSITRPTSWSWSWSCSGSSRARTQSIPPGATCSDSPWAGSARSPS
jgi:hypothetical protein